MRCLTESPLSRSRLRRGRDDARGARVTVSVGQSSHVIGMDRRTFVAGVSTLLAVPLAVEAQQVGKVYHIGVLDRTPMALNVTNLDAFRQGLREFGYVEGQNFVIEYRYSQEYRYTEGSERLASLAKEL